MNGKVVGIGLWACVLVGAGPVEAQDLDDLLNDAQSSLQDARKKEAALPNQPKAGEQSQQNSRPGPRQQSPNPRSSSLEDPDLSRQADSDGNAAAGPENPVTASRTLRGVEPDARLQQLLRLDRQAGVREREAALDQRRLSLLTGVEYAGNYQLEKDDDTFTRIGSSPTPLVMVTAQPWQMYHGGSHRVFLDVMLGYSSEATKVQRQGVETETTTFRHSRIYSGLGAQYEYQLGRHRLLGAVNTGMVYLGQESDNTFESISLLEPMLRLAASYSFQIWRQFAGVAMGQRVASVAAGTEALRSDQIALGVQWQLQTRETATW